MAKKNNPPPANGYLFPRVARALRECAGIRPAEMARALKHEEEFLRLIDERQQS